MSILSGLLAVRSPGPASAEPIGAEPSLPPISRRTFITGILAAGLAPDWLVALPDLSSEEAIDEAWDYPLDDPVAFFVDAHGTLGLGLEPASPPKTRREAFDLSLSDLESPSRLSLAAESCPPLQWAIDSALEEMREEVGRDPDEIDGLEAVLQTLPVDLFERLRARLVDWLEDKPDGAYEQDHFASWFRQQEGALEYFQDLGLDEDVLEELGVRLVEGEHPGSTYYAAELRRPIEKANRRARQLGIPVLFVEHEEPQTNTTAEGA